MTYEEMKIAAHEAGLNVKEKPLQSSNGRINGNKIAIRRDLPSSVHKKCVLAEELGHYHTTTGNIIDQSDTANRKQELRARMWAYDKLVSLDDLIKAHNYGCQSRFEIAEYLEVTEEFLQDALLRYEAKYGTGVMVGEYFLSFSQGLMIYKILK